MIPLTHTDLEAFSPPAYANLEPRPVFRFRPATARSKRRYSQALMEEGLRFHTDEVVEAEVVRAMRGLWEGDPAQLAANEARLRAFNETVRQARKDPTVAIDPKEAEAILLAVSRLTDVWPMLRRMNADNARFNEDAPKIALGQFLAGWSNLQTAFRLEDGIVPLDALDDLERELTKVEARAMLDRVEGINPGVAFSELTLHALSLLGLTEDAEKNSLSPSSPSATPSGSMTDGSAAVPQSASSESTDSLPASA